MKTLKALLIEEISYYDMEKNQDILKLDQLADLLIKLGAKSEYLIEPPTKGN